MNRLHRVIEEWDQLGPSHRIRTSIDEICQHKGVDPVHFIAVVAEAGMRFRDNAQVFIAALDRPEIGERVADALRKRDEAIGHYLERTSEKPDRPADSNP